MQSALSRRAFGAVAIAALAASALVACGDDAPTPTAPLTGSISFWHAYSADSKEVKALRTEVIPGFRPSIRAPRSST